MLPLRDRMLGSLLGAAVGESLAGGTAGVSAAIDAAESLTRSQRARLETPENGSQSVSAAWGVMAALPVALFFHHDRDRCHQQLQQLTVRWQLSPSLAWGLLAVADAVAGKTSMTQTLAESEFGETVRAAIAGRYNLDATLQALGSRDGKAIAVAVAAYCFLDTPEDFFLTVKRSQRSPHPQLSTALAGALSGAYNGTAAVPVTWELAVTERDRLREASDRLYAAWSGVCDVGQAAVWEGTIVGAAGGLRSP